jgi:biotin carboxylase
MTPPRKTLLIVGAGVFQTYAIRVARDMGLRVCAIDRDPGAPGARLADDFIAASTRDAESALEAASVFHARYRLNGVFTCGTDVSVTVARIAREIGLPGIPPRTALRATDKGLMRKALKKAGLPVPEFRVIRRLKDAVPAANAIGFPLVIKPVDNMGARGVRICRNPAEVLAAWPDASGNASNQNVILESYIPARELSIDTLVEKGDLHPVTVADRIIAFSPYCIEKGHTIPSACPPGRILEALDMAQKGVRALGILNGAAKFDMRLSAQGPVIGEMTARLSGGFHCQLTEPLATGMNSIKAAIDLCLGRPLNLRDVTPKYHRAACERSLYPRPGRVVAVKGVERARRMPGIAEIVINVRPNDILRPLRSNIGKAGHVIGSGSTRKNAVRNTLNAVRAVEIETVPCDAEIPGGTAAGNPERSAV